MSTALERLHALEPERRRVIGRLFFRAARWFQHEASERIHAAADADHRLLDNTVLVHLQTGGVGISELARRAGVSRQAMAKAVKELEGRGLVRREPDPQDARAHQVFHTEEGAARMVEAVEIVRELDRELASIIGAERLEVVRGALRDLLEAVDPSGF